jgi:DNA modification methylase
METNIIINGDSVKMLKTLPPDSVHCCVTSPPYYGLRDYGIAGQIGREESPERYIARLAAVFREVYRVLRPDGTLWLNIADT